MIRAFYIFSFFLICSVNTNAQDTILPPVTMDIQHVDTLQVQFWKDGFYNEYPKEKNLNTEVKNDFTDFSKQYDEVDFQYNEKKLLEDGGFWGRLSRRIENFFSKFDILPNMKIEEWMFTVLKILGVLVIIYIIYRLILSGKTPFYKTQKEDQKEDHIRYVEKNLMDLDIDEYVKSAINNTDYPLAIRYLHLSNVKKLAQKNVVQWEYQKTNRDLIDEIEDNKLKELFKENTRIFNQIWFGSKEINQNDFENYQALFNQLNNELK